MQLLLRKSRVQLASRVNLPVHLFHLLRFLMKGWVNENELPNPLFIAQSDYDRLLA
jgi:hypothetical protein